MLQSYQELTKSLPQSLQQNAGGSVLGVAKKPKRKKVELTVIYQTSESPNSYRLDNAFDTLFEETLRQINDLTTNDN